MNAPEPEKLAPPPTVIRRGDAIPIEKPAPSTPKKRDERDSKPENVRHG